MGSLNMQSFLRHSGNAGGKTEFLSGWKESKDRAVTVWLHRSAGITALWRHSIPSIETREDKATHAKHTEIWSNRYGCWETEDVLRFQNRMDGDERQVPPVTCGVCKLLEWVRGQVESNAMPLGFPLFKFEATGGKNRELVLPAAGIYDGLKKISDAEKAAIKASGITIHDAYRYDMRAKLNYAFVVVNEDDPKKGLQVAMEGTLLGQKMQSAIRKEMKRKGEEEGDPERHPYAFRWEYFPDATDIQSTYDATVLDRVKLTPMVDQLISGKDVPSIAAMCEKLNPRTILARLQRYVAPEWQKKIPWEQMFGPNIDAFERYAAQKTEEKPAPRTPEVAGDKFYEGVVPAKNVGGKVTRVEPAPRPTTPLAAALAKAGYAGENWAEPNEDDPGAVACDKCDRGIFVDWPVCPFCGTVYATPEPTPAPVKKFPSRAEAAAAKKAAVPAPKVAEEPKGSDFDDEEDGEPF